MTAVTVFAAYLWANKLAAAGLLVGVVGSASVLAAALEKCLAFLLVVFPGLQGPDDELKHVAAWLDGLANAKWLNSLALNRTLKALLVPVLALALFSASPAHAQVLVSTGPTLPLMEVRPGNPHPVSLAPGAGYQLSLTLPELQRVVGGRAWDLLDVNLMAFGAAVSSSSGATFGALSVAVGLCTLSSLVCLGGGHDVATSPGLTPGWFALFAFSINIATAPQAPPVGVAKGAAGFIRANTLYLGAF